MGIYDRDYIRSEQPRQGAHGRGGISGIRMWSVNTWIIVACIAVFVIDGFLPPRWVPMQTQVLIDREDFSKLDPSVLKEGDRIVVTVRDARGQPLLGLQPLFYDSGAGLIEVARHEVRRMKLLESILHFSTAPRSIYISPTYGLVGFEFWRFVGFQFLHASLAHVLFNMIAVFFFGPIVERYLGGKRYLAFYLLCGIFGEVMYMLLNLGGVVASQVFGTSVAIPGLLFNQASTPLIGASAGVFGVLMAGAYLAPNATVLAFFFLPIRLQTFAYVLVGVAFLTVLLAGNNAGGEASHLGGALAGFYFIRHPRHLHGFFDLLGRIDPTSHHYRHGSKRGGRPRGGTGREEIDRILDKISSEGLHALTDREKKILRQASER